ncbi:MAG TPA: hypothetical protein DCK76_04455 [Desulfotomaculum sp.]|nr:hypothetical protein [Desulfotomaculum sp.]HBY03399.1 hypothetical protein [Desulfotomaculum sp.]
MLRHLIITSSVLVKQNSFVSSILAHRNYIPECVELEYKRALLANIKNILRNPNHNKAYNAVGGFKNE